MPHSEEVSPADPPAHGREADVRADTLLGRASAAWISLVTRSPSPRRSRTDGDDPETGADEGRADRHEAIPPAVLHAIPDPFVVVNADGRVQAANEAVRVALGHDPEALVGLDLADAVLAPAHREAFRDRLRQYAATGERDALGTAERLTVCPADGSQVVAEVAIRPVPGPDRSLFGVCLREPRTPAAEAPDAAALDAAEGRRRTLHTILDAIPDQVVAVNRAGHVVFRNDASVRTLGRTAGREPASGGPLPDPQRREAEAVMRSGTPVFGHEEADAAGGVRLTTRVPVTDASGVVVGLVAISRDVTAQKAGEARLLDATRAAEAAARANSEFLATTSHEVRTLMSGVTGMTTLLLDTALDDEQRDFVDTIRSSGDALLRVVHDVLDLSKIDAGMLEIEERAFSVRQVVKGSLGMVAQQGAAKGLALSFDIADDVPETVLGDPVRVQQVLVNLLTNALKFTEEGSVRIRVGLAPPVSGGEPTLAFAVEDTGVGIAPDRLDAVFERFVQADASTARTHGGTGLGLTICRRLVSMMGGEMSVESVAGGGSVFQFTIVVRVPSGDGVEAASAESVQRAEPGGRAEPDERASAEPSDAPDDPPRPSQSTVMDAGSILPSAKVLLVEDDPVMQKVTALTLRRLGYSPTVVNDGAKAVMAVRGRAYDVVLMDVMMPVMDGFEATRQIRSYPGPHGAPAIVALTANAMEGDRERCLDAGCDDYLSKPVAPRHLASTIERAIRARADVPEAA